MADTAHRNSLQSGQLPHCHSYDTTAGIYAFSTKVKAEAFGSDGGPAPLWSGGETGITQAMGLRKLKDIFLKHVDQFIAAHPAG